MFKNKSIFDVLFDDHVKQSNTDDNIQNDQTMNTTNDNTRKSIWIRKTMPFSMIIIVILLECLKIKKPNILYLILFITKKCLKNICVIILFYLLVVNPVAMLKLKTVLNGLKLWKTRLKHSNVVPLRLLLIYPITRNSLDVNGCIRSNTKLMGV